MEDESSNDVIALEPVVSRKRSISAAQQNKETGLGDRPLMQFFKRLILNKHSQNTMLTNAQLEDILNKEFNFDLLSLHMLEVEIYVTILKKYLKEWPMWDEFETTTKDLTDNYDPKTFVNILETRYNHLKTYLKTNLEIATELAADPVVKIKNAEMIKLNSAPETEESKSSRSDVVLEIKATREQLNKLIYRQPHRELNNTIFNVQDKALPKHISLNTLSLEAILNWWSIRITISLQSNTFFITRETVHELEHLLVNRNGKCRKASPLVKLNEEIQIKEGKKISVVSKRPVQGCLSYLTKKHTAEMKGMKSIINCVKKDIERMHHMVAPAQYRRYLSKYPYVRYLHSDAKFPSTSDHRGYDIQLKETISPMHQLSIGRLDITLDNTLPAQWLKVECVACNVTFSGEDLATDLRRHFDECHHQEPDWQCSNCMKTFPMAELAEKCWSHNCDETAVNKS